MSLFSGSFSIFTDEGSKLPKAKAIQRENERSNLLTVTRLVLRSFLEETMTLNKRLIDVESRSLGDLLMMLEKVLWHGFRPSGQRALLNLRSPDAEMWSALARIGRSLESMKETVQCVEQMDSVVSPICRIRAFIRLSLMQKKLSDHFTHIAQSPFLKDHFESWALLRQEDIVQLTGALLGLCVVDCNLALDSANLQDQPLNVDLSLYIRFPTILTDEERIAAVGSHDGNPAASREKKVLLDQNHYLEERNRQLQQNIDNLRRKLEELQPSEEKSAIVMEQEMVSFRLSGLNGDVSNSTKSKPIGESEEELEKLKFELAERDDTIRLLQVQVSDTQAVNTDLYEKMRSAEDAVRLLEKDAVRIRDHHSQEKANLHRTIEQLEQQANNLSQQLQLRTASDDSLEKEFRKKCDQFTETLALLEAKQQELAKAQIELISAKKLAEKMRDEALQLPFVKEELQDVRDQLKEMERRANEAEQIREELGGQLSESKLKILELAEEFLPLTDAEWAKDSEVADCRKCSEKFTIAKRKHHCRMCGHIFCDPCSSYRVRLPSNPKPVRVCEQCYVKLQNRPKIQ